MRDTKGNRATKHYSAYSPDRKYIPTTMTEYIKSGSRWKETNKTEYPISRNQASIIYSKTAQPFESSHRLTKKDRYGHDHPYDTYQTISPDRQNKVVWHSDFAKGEEIYDKIQRKSFYDRQRYKAKKNGGK